MKAKKVENVGLECHHVIEKRWVHTHGLHAWSLPELEARGVPPFLVVPASEILREVAEHMLATGKAVGAGETMEVGFARVRFVRPVPLLGDEDHYRHTRLEVVDAGEYCECCGMPVHAQG